ncbi:hypothetical protein ACFE04_000724 [Oxalis oulophora]
MATNTAHLRDEDEKEDDPLRGGGDISGKRACKGKMVNANKDLLVVLDRDLMLKVLSYLDARSTAVCLLISRGWHAVAFADRLWTSKCEELWHGKAHIPRMSRAQELSKLTAYSLSIMDSKRTRITKDDLCDHAWEFHYTKAQSLLCIDTSIQMGVKLLILTTSIPDAHKEGGTGPIA